MNLLINERDADKKELEGRTVYWLQTPETTGGRYNSVCTVVYDPGARAYPAHAHDKGEETIYVESGSGKVKVGEEIFDIARGSLVLFPQGVPHMVWNTGQDPMHLICFYGPQQSAIDYTFHEGLRF